MGWGEEERMGAGVIEARRVRTGGSGVETERTRELRGLRRGGNREKEAILTKEEGSGRLCRVTQDKRRLLQYNKLRAKWRKSSGASGVKGDTRDTIIAKR